MEIMAKVTKVSERISTQEGQDDATRLQEQAVKAVIGGMSSEDWKTYMKNYVSNAAQLQRLIGKDEKFMATSYGALTLSYIAGGGTCGGGTTLGLVMEMPAPLRERLEAGLSPVTVPEEIA